VDVEARARLSSVREVCEHEPQALENLRDPRPNGILKAISTLQAEIAAALANPRPPPMRTVAAATRRLRLDPITCPRRPHGV
jgi:hypothetical protein